MGVVPARVRWLALWGDRSRSPEAVELEEVEGFILAERSHGEPEIRAELRELWLVG